MKPTDMRQFYAADALTYLHALRLINEIWDLAKVDAAQFDSHTNVAEGLLVAANMMDPELIWEYTPDQKGTVN